MPAIFRLCWRKPPNADLVVKHSGVGVFDELLEAEVLKCRSERHQRGLLGRRCVRRHWPAWKRIRMTHSAHSSRNTTLFLPMAAVRRSSTTMPGWVRGIAIPFITRSIRKRIILFHQIPHWRAICCLLAIACRIVNAAWRNFFLRAAELAPEFKFALGGEGWGGKRLPANVRWIGHVGTGDHNRVNCSARMVLNINRDSMAGVGFSPPTRIFEAAGAGACLITDRWAGIETFFAPGKEILVAGSAEEIVGHLRNISDAEAQEIGANMRQRALRDHTYALRAQEFDAIIENAFAERQRR